MVVAVVVVLSFVADGLVEYYWALLNHYMMVEEMVAVVVLLMSSDLALLSKVNDLVDNIRLTKALDYSTLVVGVLAVNADHTGPGALEVVAVVVVVVAVVDALVDVHYSNRPQIADKPNCNC
jgi:hypothetical protein